MLGQAVLKCREFGHLVGSPVVVVERTERSATVWMHQPPWGWGAQEKQFLDPQSPSVDCYAEGLLARIRKAGAREAERRARIKAANGGGK